jgi:hypothetical protein
MSLLTQFFPKSPVSRTDGNAQILLVGGGAGNGLSCWGGGGGGTALICANIAKGTTYPVTVGAGGAAGCCSPTCFGASGGKGSPGGVTRFGEYVALGGGAAGHLCINPIWSSNGSCTLCGSAPIMFVGVPSDNGGNGGTTVRFGAFDLNNSHSVLTTGQSQFSVDAISVNGGLQTHDDGYVCSPQSCSRFGSFLGAATFVSQPSPTCCVFKSPFYDLCVGNQPYSMTFASPACVFNAGCTTIACSRYLYPNSPYSGTCLRIPPNANTGHASLGFQVAGDSGVAIIVYPCPRGAATSSPGAVDCTPVTGPLGFRSYKFTSSGSFTL